MQANTSFETVSVVVVISMVLLSANILLVPIAILPIGVTRCRTCDKNNLLHNDVRVFSLYPGESILQGIHVYSLCTVAGVQLNLMHIFPIG